jgi:predicted PurR-regulated permease PerM/ribosomal protein S27AE
MDAKISKLNENKAVNSQNIFSYKKEFVWIRPALAVLRYVLIAISIYCSSFFFSDLLNAHLQNISFITSFIIALVIEVIGNQFVDKFFKFAYKGRYAISVTMLTVSVLFFGISFYSATNGLAIRQYQAADTSKAITDINERVKSDLKTDYLNQISDYKEHIKTVKKQTWRGKLSEKNISIINTSQRKIDSLQSVLKNQIENTSLKQANEITNVKQYATNEADKFYKVVVFIMFLLFASTGVLRYLKFMVEFEADKMASHIENLQEVGEQIQKSVIKSVQDNVKSIAEATVKVISNQLIEINTNKATPKEENKEPEKKIGFGIPQNSITKKTTSNETTKNDTLMNRYENRNETNDTSQTTPTNETTTNKKNDSNETTKTRVCAHCGTSYIYKHNKQVYCCNKCRLTAWEIKHGKKLHFNKI